MATSASSNVKEQVRALLDSLPDDASWDDVLYAAAVRRAIESGLGDIEAGRVVTHAEVLREFGLER